MEYKVCNYTKVVAYVYLQLTLYLNQTMLTVKLNGGLGNQLFQLAAGYSVARSVGYAFYLRTTVSPVTHQNYFDSIFRNLRRFQHNPFFIPKIVEEPEFDVDWRQVLKEHKHVCLKGYFQNHKYILKEFVDLLNLPETPALEGVFLHIRGGDSRHEDGLEEYYRTAVSLFPPGTMFYVFTDDISYAKTFSFLNTIPHKFIDEPDEVKALSMMRNCRYGGICANSTFSWWAAYLNRSEERAIFLPSTSMEGCFFPEAIVLQV